MDIRALRRQQLEDGLKRDLELLKQYEDMLRLSDDPRERARCQHEIAQLKALVIDKEAELHSLAVPQPLVTPQAGERASDEWPVVGAEHLYTLITSPDGPDPIWLLGAGASRKSGVPLGGELVERAAKWAYCRAHQRSRDDNTVMRSDWLPWLHRQRGYDRNHLPEAQYITAISDLLQPVQERREFFRRFSKPGIPPGEGYRRILGLMVTRRVRTVLTTNFDTVLAERLGSDHPRYADALVYQQRLQENIAQARQYGDTETRRAERVQILDSLNRITQESLNMPFNALCESAIQQTGEIHITPSVTATPLIDIYSDREDWLNLPDSSYATTLPGSTSSLPNVQEWLYSNLLPIVEHPTIIYSATGSQSYRSLSSWCGQEGSGTVDRTQPYLCASIRYLHCQGESNAYAQ